MASMNFVSISAKCPVCSKSLMDSEHKVDNEPGIKMLITVNDKRETIWLSSIYGSYNYECTYEPKDKEILKLNCPHCLSELDTEDELCEVCNAPIVTLLLDMGGKVKFCSRKNCKNHIIGFEDLSKALKMLYEEYGYGSKSFADDVNPLKDIKTSKTIAEEHKEIIETGSFLSSYCPHCKKSLIIEDMLKLKIINEKGEEGFVMLSPYLNVFSSKSTVYLPEDKTVKDMKCFHCDKSLIADDQKCELCGSAIARITVSSRVKMIDFFMCTKKGCRWHGVSKEDMEDIRLEDSLEW